MSFSKIKGEWKRRIAHLLVIGLCVTGIPVVPVQAQEDVPYTSEVQSVSESDMEQAAESAPQTEDVQQEESPSKETQQEETQEAQSEEVQSVSTDETTVSTGDANSVVSVELSILKDKIYYRLEDWDYDVIDYVNLTLGDGTVVSIEGWSHSWCNYGLEHDILDSEGNIAQTDSDNRYPAGEYTFKLYRTSTGEVLYELPYQVVYVEDEAIEITCDETVSGLSGTDAYKTWDYLGGHWFKIEVTEAGKYELSKTAPGRMQFVSFDDDIPNYGTYSANNQSVYISKSGTYYWYVVGSETFDVTLKKVPSVTKITPMINTDLFYYEVQKSIRTTDVLSCVMLALEDGTATSYSEGGTTGNDHRIKYELYDAEGNLAQLDEQGKYPVGDYVYKITADSGVSCEVPFKVVNIDTVATPLAVGETISGLSGSSLWGGSFAYIGGHWLKLELNEAGIYTLTKTVYGVDYILMPSGYCQGSGSTTHTITATEAGTYYCYVKGLQDFDVTVTGKPGVIAIEPLIQRDVFYYEMENTTVRKVLSGVELTLDNDTTETCSYNDSVWYNYGLSAEMLNPDGTYIEQDANYKYPVGEYICRISVYGKDIYRDIPIKIVSITDSTLVLPELSSDKIVMTEAVKNGCYKLEIAEDGLYELLVEGETTGRYYMKLYGEDSTLYRSISYVKEENRNLGELKAGTYYVMFSGSTKVSDTDTMTIQLKAREKMVSLEYTGAEIVFQYGNWGYKVNNSISGNGEISLVNYSEISANQIHSVTIEGTLSDGSNIDIAIGDDTWKAYQCKAEFINPDGSAITTDYSGYVANGEYLMRISAYGGASVEIPFRVTGGPEGLIRITYSGGTQRFEYGTWGYTAGEHVSGNKTDTPKKPNSNLNDMLSGNNNALGLEFTVEGEKSGGETVTIPYGGSLWDWYLIQTYFYDAEGNDAYTDAKGYLATGSYLMQCTTYNGLTFDVPFEVYRDAADATEEQLETAVDKMLESAGTLSEENFENATSEEKEAAVEEILQEVGQIHEEQDIGEIGAALAENTIALVEKLLEIEQKIEALIHTAVTVVPKDDEAENIGVEVKNALLSVPAGEDAELRVTSTDVPENNSIKKNQAVAVKLELITEKEEKRQLQAPVVITMKVPDGVREDEEIAVYHYRGDNAGKVEKISVVLNDNHTISFVTGSFSTFVIANVLDEGNTVSGTVTCFGTETEAATLKLLDAERNLVAQTTAAVDTGLYQFESVADGDYILEVTKPNHVAREYSITVEGTAIIQDAEIWLLGDVSGDGKINAKDQKLVYNHIAKTKVFEGYEAMVGDVSGDDKINAKDQKLMYNHIAGEKLIWQ